jgi:hypothetical protein
MSKKLIYLFSFVLVLGQVLTSGARGELVGWWRLDEGSGTIAYDSSSYGRDGSFQGNPQWVAGKIGGALEFDGDDHVVVPDAANINPESITMATWVYFNDVSGRQDFVSRNDDYAFSLGGNPMNGKIWAIITTAGDWLDVGGETLIELEQWYHVALTYDADTKMLTLYLDGEEDGEGSAPTGMEHRLGGSLTIGTYQARYLEGRLDEIKIWDEALSADEIQFAMQGEGYPFAFGPEPADGAYHEDTWVNLSWKPGDFALSHDVYLGNNFDDVNDGVPETFQGNQTSTFIVVGFPGFPFPDGLVPGTTYYWRIDEVNDAEPNSPWKGDVWSFSVPPKTAYFPEPADGAEFVDMGVQLSWTPGFGAKLHTVYFGDNFDDVDNAAGGVPQGAATYAPGPLKLAQTYYWRVDEFDVVETYKGNVWSFTTQGAVGKPNPANGAVDVKQTQIITWAPSVFAASHEVYFGTDKDAVKNANTGSPEYKGTRDLGDESYDPGMLLWDTTYYWRVDEVNDTNPDSPWPGILWSFTTANFLIVDDFESYNDLDPADPESNRIFNAWIDGYDDPTNGSLVGYEVPPFAEQTIVHSGNQSMPLYYDNSVGYSEATLTLTYPRDWTEKGVDTLTIWFRGNSDNAAETLYVALNGNAIVTNDNPNAAQTGRWTEWSIPLQAFVDQGVNLTNVNTISLGLGDKNNPQAGGSGTMYFDDIRLYPPAPAP